MKKIFILACFSCSLLMGTIRNVPAMYATIQAALTACVSGDTVMVQPGNHMGNIIWPATSNIKLFSAGDSSNTTIMVNTGRVIQLNSLMTDTNTVIRGFTIRSGTLTTGSGAGISVNTGGLKLIGVVVRNNSLYNIGTNASGAGLYMNNASVVLENTTIRNNQIDTGTWCYGAGMHQTSGSLTIRNSKILSNVSKSDSWCYGTGLYVSTGTIRITNAQISGNRTGNNPTWNYGAGAYLDDCQGNLTNVLVSGNSFGTGGSFNNGIGIFIDGATGNMNLIHITFTNNYKTASASANGTGLYVRSATAVVNNSIFWNANPGTEITNSSGTLNVNYSDVEGGYFGIGNINTNPLFVSASDYHLQTSSPCAGVGTLPGSPVFDLDYNSRPMPVATNPDMGCYEVSQLVSIISCCLDAGLRVYPIPTNGALHISTWCNSEPFVFGLFDLSGKLLMNGNSVTGQADLDLGRLSEGIYFLKLAVSGKTLTKKVVVAK